MNVESNHHLGENEKAAIASGLVEDGETVDHVEGCPECAAAIERLRDLEEDRLLAGISGDAPSEWFRVAAAETGKELEAFSSAVEPRSSGSYSVPPKAIGAATSVVDPKRIATSGVVGSVVRFRPVAMVVGSVAALAAAYLLVPRPPANPDPSLNERTGGVNATLHCSARPEVAALGHSDWCPVGADLGIRASPVPNERLSAVTVVSCKPDGACDIVASSRVDGTAGAVLIGPRMSSDAPLRIVVVWSERAFTKEFLMTATQGLLASGEVPRLSLPEEWSQDGFVVRVEDDAGRP
jgi:hypothetical protein